MTFLDNLSPEDLLILTNALAISFSKNKTADEINVIGNFVVGVGCLMLTIASQEQYLTLLKEQADNAKSSKQNNNSNNDSVAEDDITIG